jgi:hypothetical protein
MNEIKERREQIIQEHKQRQEREQKELYDKFSGARGSTSVPTDKINEMTMLMNELLMENTQLKDKVKYLEEKIKKIITQQIEERKRTLN